MALRMQDWWCDACAARVAETLEETPVPAARPCPRCGGEAEPAIGAPKVKTVWGAAVERGKPDEKPHEFAMDTSALADGMSMTEWRAKRKKIRNEVRHRRVRKLLG